MNLTPIFEAAVPVMSRKQSESLGDRSQYIGSSDIAGCPRKTYLQRQFPIQPGVSTLLKFARGHAAEWLLNKIFDAAQVPYDSQLEIQHPNYPLMAHLDLVFYQPDGLHAVEVKSVSGIPDAPFPQWVDQLQYQLGMLRMMYPTGSITGSVLAVDLNAGEVHQFNGYEHDETIFNYLFHRGLHLLDVLNEQAEADCSPSHLCGYCQFRSDCPSMSLPKVQLPPEIEMIAAKYAELNGTKTAAEKEMKAIRQELIDYTGSTFKGQTERLSLTVSTVADSVTVDANLLKLQHPEIYQQVLKPKAGFSRLEVKPLRPPLAKAA